MLEDIINAYKSTEECYELEIKKHEGSLNHDELRRYWEVRIGGKDNFVWQGVPGFLGNAGYMLIHPINYLKGLYYFYRNS